MLSQIPSTILVVCVLSALIIVFCWLFHIHFFGLFLIASANILDVIFVSSFFAILAYYLFNLTLLQSKSLFPCAIICFVFAASVVFRIVFHFYSQKKAQCLKTNVLDLKDLYSISKESLDIFFDDTTIIENIFSSTQPKTESEKFVKEIYMSFKDGKADFFGDKAVKSTEEIKPTL